MSEILTTLKRKGDDTTSVYPNVKGGNIPSNAITSSKINANAVTTAKINDGAVTTAKIENNAVTDDKIASASINYFHFANDVTTFILQLQRTYLVYMGDSDNTRFRLFGTTTLSNILNEYTQSEIDSAFDFNKNQVDYTQTDLEILKIFIDGFESGADAIGSLESQIDDKYSYFIFKNAGNYTIQLYDEINNQTLFHLAFDSSYNITSFTNTKYIYIGLVHLINRNVNMELN